MHEIADTDAAEAFAGYLDELDRLCSAATPGPWTLDPYTRFVVGPDGGMLFELEYAASERGGALSEAPSAASLASAQLAIAARHALPRLIATVRELQGMLVTAEALADKAVHALKGILEPWERAKRQHEAGAAVVLGFKERAEKAEAELAKVRGSAWVGGEDEHA